MARQIEITQITFSSECAILRVTVLIQLLVKRTGKIRSESKKNGTKRMGKATDSNLKMSHIVAVTFASKGQGAKKRVVKWLKL